MADQGYARPEMLADSQWLAAHLQYDNIRIVDCDNREAYRRAHIPSAITVRGHNYLKEKEGALRIMGPDQFAQTMGDMGIGNDTPVVAYDGFSGLYAARFWWALNYYGHTNVKVLNGGWDTWLSGGGPVTNTTTRPAKAAFAPQVHEDFIARWEQVQDAIDTDTVVLDTRSDAEWTGENYRGTKRGGRVPNAVHVEWLNYVDPKTKQFKPAAELRSLFEQAGVRPECEVITY
jgi:thiosulfate/3-mercaptopyruvate sulfurtransferase